MVGKQAEIKKQNDKVKEQKKLAPMFSFSQPPT